MSEFLGFAAIIILFLIAIMTFLHFIPLGLWISALAASVDVGIFTFVFNFLNKITNYCNNYKKD